MKTGKRGRSVDWKGNVFGDLTVVKRLGWTDAYGKGADSGAQLSQWELKCSCGNKSLKRAATSAVTSIRLRPSNVVRAVVRGDCTAMTIPVM